MADIFYPHSSQEAKREGELDKWERSHRANVRCARDIGNLIASHTQDGQLEADCARAALDWWGFLRVQYVLSNTLRNTSPRSFDRDSLHWARTVFVPPDKANAEFKVHADIPLLAAFVQQTHAEYQKLGMFGSEHCAAGELDYTGKVLILRPSVLKEECWSAQNQLWYGEGGFGCSPTASGRAVYATCLGDGEKTRWDRADFIGVLDKQYLPDWARERLAQGAPTANQRSVCGGERRSSVVSEPCRTRQGEGYEACDDARGPEQEQTDTPTQNGMEMG